MRRRKLLASAKDYESGSGEEVEDECACPPGEVDQDQVAHDRSSVVFPERVRADGKIERLEEAEGGKGGTDEDVRSAMIKRFD